MQLKVCGLLWDGGIQGPVSPAEVGRGVRLGAPCKSLDLDRVDEGVNPELPATGLAERHPSSEIPAENEYA